MVTVGRSDGSTVQIHGWWGGREPRLNERVLFATLFNGANHIVETFTAAPDIIEATVGEYTVAAPANPVIVEWQVRDRLAGEAAWVERAVEAAADANESQTVYRSSGSVEVQMRVKFVSVNLWSPWSDTVTAMLG